MADRRLVSLLELDPDLGVLLDEEAAAQARRDLQVAVHAIHPGPWDVDRLSSASPDHVGLLVLDGVLAREVLVSDTVSTELLGPGDVVRPWRLHAGSTLLRHGIRWNALTASRFALLDKRLAVQMARYPQLNAALLDRVNERALRLTVTQAISQLNRVDRRLVALFWHLAERWGRMTADGVALPMTLSHRMLGQLVGARRPTVSTALGVLAKTGEVTRRDDGTWLLRGAPVGIPDVGVARVIPMRRRLLPPEAPPEGEHSKPVHVTGVELREVLQQLRERTHAQVQGMREACEVTAQLAQHTVELRDRCQFTRDHRPAPRGRPALSA